jgi:kinesin family protein 11
METDINEIQETLEPLDEGVCQPLANLRSDIQTTILREYEPTGETPEKTQYQYPTELPHTAAHEALLAGIRDAPTPSKPAPLPTPAVFNDVNSSPSSRPPSRPTSSHSDTMNNTLNPMNPLSMSLREVNPNLTTNSLLFDPSASMLSVAATNDNTVPLMKRSVRSQSTRIARKKAISSVAEGLENVPPTAFSQASSSRRKSPRLH